MLITLLRHGDVEGRTQVLRGHSDAPLSLHGWEQLHRVWSVTTPAVTHIASSPLTRCYAFAHKQATRHQLPLTLLDDLREIDFGEWDNLTLAEAATRDPDCFARFKHDTLNWQPPSGEAYVDFRARVRRVIPALQQTDAVHLLVVTHGGVIRALLAELLDLTPDSAARIGMPLAGFCQLWLDDAGDHLAHASLLRLQWLDPVCN
jgi:alpha-ribazole phosphatase